MKRLAQILLIVLAVTALVGAFAFTASAETQPTIEVYDVEGGNIVATYDTNVLDATILTKGKYVKCNGNVQVDAALVIPDNKTVTLDLANNILTLKAKIQIGKNSGKLLSNYFCLKNGTVQQYSTEGLQPRPGSTLILENIKAYNNAANNMFMNDGGCALFVAKNCEFYPTYYTNGKKAFIHSGQGFDVGTRNYIFSNTKIVSQSSNMKFIHFEENKYPMKDLNVYFLNDCTVEGYTSTFITIADTANQTFEANAEIAFEAGFSYNGTPASYNKTGSFSDIWTYTYNVYEDITFDGTSVTLGTAFVTPEFALEGTKEGFAYEMGGTKDAPKLGFIEYDDDGKVINEYYTDKLAYSVIKSFKAGSTIKFFTDITYLNDGSDNRIQNFENNLTFDLNEFTFTNGVHFWAPSADYNLTFKNGTMICNSVKLLQSNMGSGKLTLTEVDIVAYVDSLFQIYAGTVELTDCSIKNVDKDGNLYNAFYAGLSNGNTTLNLTKVNVDGANRFLTMYPNSSVTGSQSFNVTIDNCTFANVNEVYRVTPTNLKEGSTQDVVIKNCFINVNDTVIKSSAENYFETSSVVVTNTKTNVAVYNALYGEGEVLVETADEKYPYMITEYTLPALKANLTLYQNFSMNFYLPIDTEVTAIKYNNVIYAVNELDVVTIGADSFYVFTVNGIAANKAASMVTISLGTNVDGKTLYGVVRYSVVKYAQAVIDSAYVADAKELVVSAVNYISAAYAYAGSSNAELTALVESEAFKALVPETATVPETTTNVGDTNKVISSVQLALGTNTEVIINLKNFTGIVTVNGKEYVVENGVYAEWTYIPLTVRAYELYDVVFEISVAGTVTVEDVTEDVEATGTYSIAAYINGVEETEENATLVVLLDAFYTYLAEAHYYRANYAK